MVKGNNKLVKEMEATIAPMIREIERILNSKEYAEFVRANGITNVMECAQYQELFSMINNLEKALVIVSHRAKVTLDKVKETFLIMFDMEKMGREAIERINGVSSRVDEEIEIEVDDKTSIRFSNGMFDAVDRSIKKHRLPTDVEMGMRINAFFGC